MAITVRTELKDYKLGGLAAIGEYIDLCTIDDRDDKQQELFLELVQRIFSVSRHDLNNTISQDEFAKAHAVLMNETVPNISMRFHEILTQNDYPEVFVCRSITKKAEAEKVGAINALKKEIESSFILTKRRKKQQLLKDIELGLKDSLNGEMFYVHPEPENLAAGLWVKFTMPIEKKLQGMTPQTYYKIFKYIPTIVACVSWLAYEQTTEPVPNNQNAIRINHTHIKDCAEIFDEELNAEVGSKIFSFFFGRRLPSIKQNYLQACQKLTETT